MESIKGNAQLSTASSNHFGEEADKKFNLKIIM